MFPFAIGPDRDATKPYEVRRPNEHQCRRLMTTGDVVGVGGDRARVHQPGMRSDDGAEVVDGLGPDELNHRPGGTGNPIGWLVWHLTRVQDDHVAGLAGTDQLWSRWQERFGLPFDESTVGYGHTSAEVDRVRIEDPALLRDYHEDVHAASMRYLDRVDADELDRVVDRDWDPPVTAGVRLVSVLGDCLQHLGQAAYVRGLLGR